MALGKTIVAMAMKAAKDPRVRKAVVTSAPVLLKKGKETQAHLGMRERAIRQAREIGGRYGEATIGQRRYWVVWKDGKPINSFPSLDGDLGEKLSLHDQARLRDPQTILRERAKQRVAGRRRPGGPSSSQQM
jgi:hypothetical protein